MTDQNYTKYSDLVPFDNSTNFLELMCETQNQLLESNDVNNILYSLHDLRRLNRYHKGFFFYVFDNLYDHFIKFLQNENPDVTKFTLILLSEIFGEIYLDERPKEWMRYILPVLLQLSCVKDMEEETKYLTSTCLNKVANFCFYDETCQCLINAIGSDDPLLVENAFRTIESLFRNGNRLYVVETFDWVEFFDILVNIYANPKKTANATHMIELMKTEIFKTNEFEDIMSKLDIYQITLLKSIVQFDLANVLKKKDSFAKRQIINS